MSKNIVGIVGLPGSGKSKLCEYICREYGFELYRPSDAIRAYAKAHGLKLEGRQDYVTAHDAMLEYEPDAITAPVKSSPASHICLDGIRSPLPFLELRELYGAKLIYLDCPAEVRLARIQGDATRSGHRTALTLNALLTDESPDMVNPNRNLPNMNEMRELADFTIDASAPLDEVLSDSRRILDELVKNQ